MANNRVFSHGQNLSLTVSHPAAPSSGQPVRLGGLTGVAHADEQADGKTSVDLGPAVYNLSVKGVDDNGNDAVVAGDPLYYVDADVAAGAGFLSKKTTGGVFFGFALEGVTSGATATIRVLIGHQASLTALEAGLTAAVAAAVGSIDVTVVGGAEHECAVTIQVNDADGDPIAVPVMIFVWLSDLATGLGGSVHTHSTAPAFSTGVIQQIMIATDAWIVLTDGAGKAVLDLVDTDDENVTINAGIGAVRGSDTTVAGDWAA